MRSAVLENVQRRSSARAPRRRRPPRTSPRFAPRSAVPSTAGGRVRPATTVGWRVSADQRRALGDGQRMPRLRELQRAHDAAAVVRVHGGGRRRIDGRQRGVRPGRPALVVQALCGVADAVRRLGRERHVGERRAHVEAAPAAHDRDAAAVEDLVDRIVGEVRVLGDGALVARLPHGDEMVRRPARGRPRTAGWSGSAARGRAASRRTRRSRRRPCRPARARRRSCPRRWARRSR